MHLSIIHSAHFSAAASIKGKKGAYLVEAAFIYPMIIIISAMLIMLILFFFNDTQDVASADAAVRRAAGKETETVEYLSKRDFKTLQYADRSDYTTDSGLMQQGSGLMKSFRYVKTRKTWLFSLFPVSAQSKAAAKWTSADENHLIRVADLIYEKASGL